MMLDVADMIFDCQTKSFRFKMVLPQRSQGTWSQGISFDGTESDEEDVILCPETCRVEA